ncbi:MAG: nucleoside hydrolase [Thermomicrobiales bacterium]
MATRLILDTDIGTDVDDCLALAVILGSPEIELVGVTCVYGDVGLRARMVRKLLRLKGRNDVPVYLGAGEPLLGLQPIYWPGHEGVGLLDDSDADLDATPGRAVDYIVETVMAHPGEIHLLSVGPLTNVAIALKVEPRVAERLAHLTIMGGAQHIARTPVEHNFRCDPEAAHIVFCSGAPTTLVPLDVTLQVTIDQAGVEKIRQAGTPFHDAVARQVELYPRFRERGSTFLHDPLAAAIIARPELVKLTPMRIDIETEGRFSAGVSLMQEPADGRPANAAVALDVDVEAAEAFIVERIAATFAISAPGKTPTGTTSA